MQTYFKRLTKGTITIFMFIGLSALVGYILKVFFARTITQEDIGLFYSTLSFIGFFSVIRDLGISDSLVYFIPKFLAQKSKEKIKTTINLGIKIQISISIIFIALTLLFSKTLSNLYFHNSKAGVILIFLSFFYLVDSFQETLYRSFQGFQNMFLNQLIDFSFLVISTLGIVAVTLLKLDIVYLGLIYFLSSLINSIIFSFVFLKKTFPDFFKVKTLKSVKFSKSIFKYSLPVMTGNFAGMVFSSQTPLILTYFLGLESVAQYVYAYSLAKITVYFSKSINQVFAPLISEMWNKKEYMELKKILNIIFTLFFLIGLPLAITMFVFSDELLELLFGPSFEIASLLLKFLTIYFIFYNLTTTYQSMFSNIGKPKKSRNITFLIVILNLTLNMIFIPIYGLLGAGIADLTTMFIAFFFSYAQIIKLFKWHLPYGNIIKIVFSSFIFILVPIIIRNMFNISIFLKIILSSIIGGVFYLALVMLLSIVNIKEINQFINSFKKTN